ncbi:hypothetical protein KL929_002507 [Ogataea haglerorum]|nr:hypothetical protein KL929_002507 [Ogataea haglerorum]
MSRGAQTKDEPIDVGPHSSLPSDGRAADTGPLEPAQKKRRVKKFRATHKRDDSAPSDVRTASPSPAAQSLVGLNQEQKDEIIRQKYNEQTHHARKSRRTESKIYKLRSFNNCIKYILIYKYARPGGNVLDLGCGKGGDMAKWEAVQTRSYVGIDLSDLSIKEAFDTVSMQFCMHYAFDSELTVRNMLQNVARSLKVGGMFIGTIPSSDFIRWKVNKLGPGERKWGNSIYSVEFPSEPPKDAKFANPFGNVYNYYLVDAVDNVPEYVVPFETFRALCESYNLELRYKKNFFELFNKEIPNYFRQLPTPVVESLRREDGSYGVSGEDRDACSFYLAFAFEKVGA